MSSKSKTSRRRKPPEPRIDVRDLRKLRDAQIAQWVRWLAVKPKRELEKWQRTAEAQADEAERQVRQSLSRKYGDEVPIKGERLSAPTRYVDLRMISDKLTSKQIEKLSNTAIIDRIGRAALTMKEDREMGDDMIAMLQQDVAERRV